MPYGDGHACHIEGIDIIHIKMFGGMVIEL